MGMPAYVDVTTAAARISTANRILVIGCSGSGKSTLSLDIARRLGLTYISLDRDVLWLPGWVERDRIEQRRILAAKVLEERWIMDGTNPSTFDIRLPRADLVIWLQMSRWLCLWGVAMRWLKWRGLPRPEMAPGCSEKLDWEFLHYIWTFDQRFAPRIVAEIDKHGPAVPVLQLKSRADIRHLLDTLG
jgi:adenylate kinase family enzyme